LLYENAKLPSIGSVAISVLACAASVDQDAEIALLTGLRAEVWICFNIGARY
jgi:hypothetical protein